MFVFDRLSFAWIVYIPSSVTFVTFVYNVAFMVSSLLFYFSYTVLLE